MMSDIPPPPSAAEIAGPSAVYTGDSSYIDWAAIIAGAVFALALSILLMSFGASLGLSLTSPYEGEGMSAVWAAIAVGIWFAWVMVTGFGAGGYLCGRMRRRIGDATPDEVEVRDSTHGLMVWATGAVAGMILAATGVGAALTAGGPAAGAAVDAAADAVTTDYFANVMLRSEEPGGLGAGATAQGVNPAAQQEIAGILTRSVAEGEMSERDRNYLAQIVAANSDLNAAAARARVDQVNAEITQVREEAAVVADRVRVTTVVFGFIAAATLLLGAVAAFFAAAAGGRHRNEGLGYQVFAVRR